MAIDEAQLQIWANQGSITQSASTYASIRNALRSANAPYVIADTDCFLQGSYGNDTNVWAESDVDIVIQYVPVWVSDRSHLSVAEEQAYLRDHSQGGVAYGYDEFRRDVLSILSANFIGVTPGRRAIHIPPNSGRRKADVLVAIGWLRYTQYLNAWANTFTPGLCFWHNSAWVENFPKQHSDLCTWKHQNTNNNFKPLVRIFKNLRNRMVDDGLIRKEQAPSYFIEGLLSNVPNAAFTGAYTDMFVAAYNWVIAANQGALTTASGLHWLVLDGTPTSWPAADYSAFLAAVKLAWDRG